MTNEAIRKAAEPKLVCAFSGEVHSPAEIGTFWSVADELAYKQDCERIENQTTEETPTPADTQAAVEDYVFWREAIEGVK